MAKLYFRHGTMGCGKSTSLLQVAHNYESVGQEVFVIKPRFDSRNGHLIQSRLGVDRCVDFQIGNDDNIFTVVKEYQDKKKKDYACILIDEVNFITKKQARQLWQVATELDIPVIAYGLRVDYTGEGFDASKELLTLAHRIEELKTVDASGKKCTMHLRSIGGRYVFEGNSLIIGDTKGEERYEACTSKKWLEEKKKYDSEKIADQIDCRGGLMYSELSIALGDGISVDVVKQSEKEYRYEIRDEYYKDHRIVGAFGLEYLEDDVHMLRFIYDSMAKEGQLFFNK